MSIGAKTISIPFVMLVVIAGLACRLLMPNPVGMVRLCE